VVSCGPVLEENGRVQGVVVISSMLYVCAGHFDTGLFRTLLPGSDVFRIVVTCKAQPKAHEYGICHSSEGSSEGGS
jgi:hypothetical protein